MKLTFLEANTPLTKSYSLSDSGELQKTSYPNVARFTTHEEQSSSNAETLKHIIAHAKLGHCLLKGNTLVQLKNESRRGSTNADMVTWYLCLDWDKAPYKSVEEALASLCPPDQTSPFTDVSYVVQYSASHGLPGTKGLNCHVFVQLSKPQHTQYLKAWLMYLNLRCPTLAAGITLSASHATLSWPLDITTCQNDKLLFIAPPVLTPAVRKLVKFPEAERYQLVTKGLASLPVERIIAVDLATMKKAAHDKKNELRREAGMDTMRTKPKLEGEFYTILSPGEAVLDRDSMVINGDWVNFNINGGDSMSYGHRLDDHEYIYCFKHPDERFRTRELLPTYYNELEGIRVAEQAAPTEEGDIILAFSDFKSSSYWRGLWSPQSYKLELAQVGSATMLDDWRMSFGRDPLEFVPPWDKAFDPTSTVVVDERAVPRPFVNTYVPTKFMRGVHTPNPNASHKKCPTIIKTMLHVLNVTEDSDVFEHWLNWLAVIYQYRIKTQTAWVLSGTEGTGKGVLGTNILAASLGSEYVARFMGNSLEEIYNGWMENSIIAVLDEVDLADSTKKNVVHQNLRKAITDSPLDYRYMHRMKFSAASYINFILCTNSKESIHLKEDDRRYNIGNYQPEKINYTQVDLDQIEKELVHWVGYIMTRPADITLATKNIKTEAHASLVESSRNSNDSIAHALNKGNFMELFSVRPNMELEVELHGLQTAIPAHYDTILRREAAGLVNTPTPVGKTHMAFVSKLTREELLTVFEYNVGNMPTTPIKFTKFLRHRGLDVEVLKIDGHAARGIHVKWIVTKAQHEELKAWLVPVAKATTNVTNIKKAKVG